MARRGLTLVEVVAVVTILVVLAGITLPVVQGTREAARRSQCLAQQRELGNATLEFLARKGHFPGYRQLLAFRHTRLDMLTGESLDAALPVPLPTPSSWAVALLPYLGREDLYFAHGEQASPEVPGGTRGVPVNTHVASLVCPSDVLAGTAGMYTPRTTNSYVANCGMQDPNSNVAKYWDRPIDLPANGVFHDHFDYNELGEKRAFQMVFMTETYVRTGDGLSSTLLFSENVDSGNWGETRQVERRLGMIWWPNVEEVDGLLTALPPATAAGVRIAGINQGRGLSEVLHEEHPDRRYLARPSSFHPGGVVAVFCDGHTAFLSEAIDYLVFCQLMTPFGRYAADPATGDPVEPVFHLPLAPGSY